MKDDEEEIAKAVRVETSKNGEVFVVFKIMNAKWKRKILDEWNLEMEFVIDGKSIRPSK